MSFKKDFILYSVSVGLNRGAILLYTPFIISMISIEDFGIYSLILILMQIVFPILTLNISSGIAREGASDSNSGVFLYNNFKTTPTIIGVLIFLVTCYFYNTAENILLTILFVLLFSAFEGLHNMQLNLFRAVNQNVKYFLFSVLKSIGFLIILYIGKNYYLIGSLNQIMFFQITWYIILYFAFDINIKRNFKIGKDYLNSESISIARKFSLQLIPHVLSLWIISSSSRLILDFFLGKKELGEFSLLYTYASLIMLINSGIGLTLPQNFIRNPEYWLNINTKQKFTLIYSIIFLSVFFCSVIIFIYFSELINLNLDLFIDNKFLYSFISLGFYFLGLYYYNSNILFYKRESKLLSKSTLFIAFFSILISIPFTKLFGSLGTGIGFFLTYVVYNYLLLFNVSIKKRFLLYNFQSDLLVPLSIIIITLLITNLL